MNNIAKYVLIGFGAVAGCKLAGYFSDWPPDCQKYYCPKISPSPPQGQDILHH